MASACDATTPAGVTESGRGGLPEAGESGAARMIDAASAGDAEGVLELVRGQGVDPNLRGHSKYHGEGWTALHEAAQEGHTDVILVLLEYKADPALQSKCAMTPLMLAAANGHTAAAEALVTKGKADVNFARTDGWVALMGAATNGHTAHVDTVKLLWRSGGNVDAVSVGEGWSVVHCAAEGGHADTVVALINDCGANAEIKAEDGTSPVQAAIMEKRKEAAAALVRECGAVLSYAEAAWLYADLL